MLAGLYTERKVALPVVHSKHCDQTGLNNDPRAADQSQSVYSTKTRRESPTRRPTRVSCSTNPCVTLLSQLPLVKKKKKNQEKQFFIYFKACFSFEALWLARLPGEVFGGFSSGSLSLPLYLCFFSRVGGEWCVRVFPPPLPLLFRPTRLSKFLAPVWFSVLICIGI